MERLLTAFHVRKLVLPAAEEAESIWTKKFGFDKIIPEEVCEIKFSSFGTYYCHSYDSLPLTLENLAAEGVPKEVPYDDLPGNFGVAEIHLWTQVGWWIGEDGGVIILC